MSVPPVGPRPGPSTRWKVWTSIFLALTVAALSMELWGALDRGDDTPPWTELLSRYVPEPVTYGVLAVVTLWVFPHLYVAYRKVSAERRALTATAPRGASYASRWLQLDALNRAWRTFLQVAVSAGGVGALDAVGQAVLRAAMDRTTGGVVDWRQVATAAGYAGMVAFLAPIVAYVHRAKIDPSRLPSAVPPVRVDVRGTAVPGR
jgi:hypothetical protein